jgi:hypothetical protein
VDRTINIEARSPPAEANFCLILLAAGLIARDQPQKNAGIIELRKAQSVDPRLESNAALCPESSIAL